MFDWSNRPVKTMDIIEYQASDAKAKFAELLNEVERGRTVRITRHGKAIARIVPEGEARSIEAVEALERLRVLRGQVVKAPRVEVLASRREGLKY
jgi:prevent-host-death family protein